MLSKLLFVRLKSAENALRDGRLDEAYRLATAPDMREHRRGSAVLATLTDLFLERARNHFKADRFTEALMDLDRAAAGGVKQDEISDLRKNIQTVASEMQRRQHSRHDRLQNAQRKIEGGSIAAGQKILEKISQSDHVARQLKNAAAHRIEDVQQTIKQAEQLMAQGQIAAAAERVRKAKSIDTHNADIVRVETRLCELVIENTRNAITEGRLSRACNELACLGELGKKLPSRREMNDILAIAKQAEAGMRTHDFAAARRHAMSLQRLLPKAKWINTVIDQLKQLEELHTVVRAGPLGDKIDPSNLQSGRQNMNADQLNVNRSVETAQAKPQGTGLDDTVALPDRINIHGELPNRLLLLVDGGGSYLLVRGGSVSIGRAASDNPADVPLYSDVSERHANINRVDEDYFLFSAKDVEVANRRTQHHLMRDGDRVVLGKKAKFTFRTPSRKSPSAVLDLSDTTKMPNDVRRVILFNQQAILGNGPTAHIRCRHAGPSLVVYERNDSLWIRSKNDGHVDTEPQQLRIGESVEIAGIRLAVEPWRNASPGTSSI